MFPSYTKRIGFFIFFIRIDLHFELDNLLLWWWWWKNKIESWQKKKQIWYEQNREKKFVLFTHKHTVDTNIEINIELDSILFFSSSWWKLQFPYIYHDDGHHHLSFWQQNEYDLFFCLLEKTAEQHSFINHIILKWVYGFYINEWIKEWKIFCTQK